MKTIYFDEMTVEERDKFIEDICPECSNEIKDRLYLPELASKTCDKCKIEFVHMF